MSISPNKNNYDNIPKFYRNWERYLYIDFRNFIHENLTVNRACFEAILERMTLGGLVVRTSEDKVRGKVYVLVQWDTGASISPEKHSMINGVGTNGRISID